MGSNQTMLMNNDKMHINERTSGPCERVTTFKLKIRPKPTLLKQGVRNDGERWTGKKAKGNQSKG